MRLTLALALSLTGLAFHSSDAAAFCGFYVSGADQSLYANATMVVMMRDGKRTVLSMQNAYKGPPEDFAMVIPVPQVLQQENVKTLPRQIFKRVDDLAAPRLVEYWETDPCEPPEVDYMENDASAVVLESAGAPPDEVVVIEAQFEVGEYEVVVLSAKDSGGLDAWLKREKYNIPAGAEPILRPYVEAGTKFFVARVNPKKVAFSDGQAVLSPLRFHYDSDDFQLPVRLGLLSSEGEQDLLVHVLARGQRYQVANYENAFIPTNIRVQDGVRDDFGRFYDALFEKASEKPRTVVTEYAWDASSCDPCPTPPLSPQELLTLGADVLPDKPQSGFTLTRMHYRYDKDGLDHDLVFEAAPPMVGGRGTPDVKGELGERTAQPGSYDNFQGRYVILHPWQAKPACASPVAGRWGGPPTGVSKTVSAPSRLEGAPASGAIDLASMVAADVESLGIRATTPAPVPAATPALEDPADVDDRGCSTVSIHSTWAGLGALLVILGRSRRRLEG